MPCFKGLAVSIHTPDGPLPEYSVQKQSRLSRISAYIPVPPPRIPPDSTTNRPEQSTFAISITLLTPGQDVPYSTPKPTPEDPHPHARVVGGLPGHGEDRGKASGGIGPYVPLTTSPNETIAAYIYFDGRVKEEVATLLRKGEETWVNSRWVSVPESEGGGLAEREFLFREVGLERWLNGLDLEGKDAAATIERRRRRLEKKKEKRREARASDDEANGDVSASRRKSTLRYTANGELENVSDDEASLSGTGSSDDDDPIPEAAGQIKVALFRVLASGEIKRGEYSPQFDAHDDDDDFDGPRKPANGDGRDRADVDHTTSFAKPKTLDPKSISTQTVTGIDPSDKPYAVFTFLYRGERQLQKMGILSSPAPDKAATAAKRRSLHVDLSSLGPLKKQGTAGFSGFREQDSRPATKSRSGKPPSGHDMESDSDDDATGIVSKMDELEDADVKKDPDLLSPEDAERTGQIAEGVRKMKLKRQHSAEPLNSNGTTEARKNSKSGSPSAASTPRPGDEAYGTPPLPHPAPFAPVIKTDVDVKTEDDAYVGSPLKKHRASMAGLDDPSTQRRLGAASNIGEVLSRIGQSPADTAAAAKALFGEPLVQTGRKDDDDEL